MRSSGRRIDHSLALVVSGLVATASVAVVGALPAAGDAPGAPAQVVDYEPPIRTESYKVTEFGRSPSPSDDRTHRARFRVVERTGNCCENYLTITPQGRLLDLGGSYINFTDDDGKSWKQVRPLEPLVNGEGTIAVAPNGDVVGVEWDPYSGDHLLSYKYDAQAKEWQFLEMPLHTPFYDRPWLAVVPGPFTIEGQKVPYVTFVDGYPHRATFLYSTDGITYVETSNPFLDQQGKEPVTSWIKTKAERGMDWILPNSNSPIVPLGGGSALAPPGPFAPEWSVLDRATQTWQPFELPEGGMNGRFLVDSKGRIHNMLTAAGDVDYRVSSDGGRSWKSISIELPEGLTAVDSDFRVNADIGVAGIVVHVDAGKTDGDVLYKLDISKDRPRLVSLYEIGLRDIDASSGVGQNIRLDFQTVAIFPDGRLAVSFLDSTTGPIYHLAEPATDRLGPAVAIEL